MQMGNGRGTPQSEGFQRGSSMAGGGGADARNVGQYSAEAIRQFRRELAERAIDLSVNKYCSVRSSLREDVPVEWTLELAGRDS